MTDSRRPLAALLAIAFLLLAAGAPTSRADAAQQVLLVTETSGNLLFLDAAAAEPTDAVIAAVALPTTGAVVVSASPEGRFAFVGHNPATGQSAVTVVSIPAVLNDTDPANDVVTTIVIPRTPSLAGQNVSGIAKMQVSADSTRLAVTLPLAGGVTENGIVYLINLDAALPGFLTIVDFQRLNPTAGTGGGNLSRPAFRPGTNELWITNGLTVGTSGAEPGIYIRDGSTLDPIANAPNFGPAEAFSAPSGVRFDGTGTFGVIPMVFNGHARIIRASTRALAGSAQFGSAGGACSGIGTSFPQVAALSPDSTKVVASSAGPSRTRPTNFWRAMSARSKSSAKRIWPPVGSRS